MRKKPSLRKRRGVAILVVMAVITLMAVLVVSMLSMAGQSRVTAEAETRIINVRMIADTAIDLTIGQLREATTQETAPGVPAPWVSQPGAVSVHERNGDLRAIHKLYSAENLTARSEAEAARDLPSKWRKYPGQFVDLNEPLASSQGTLVFPVADPRAADGEDAVEGFSYGGADAPEGTVAPGGGLGKTQSLRMPMPVRWLYQLRDGTLGVIAEDGKFKSESRARPTAENPISARFAFWADDESSKININTAGEAAPWDTPRMTTRQDLALARFQPMRGEFHRYPGHPAGVSLSSVLFPRHRWYLPGDTELENFPALKQEQVDLLWSIAPGTLSDPRMTSMGGYRRPPGLDLPASQDSTNWHLYAGPEEIVFAHGDRAPRGDIREKLARSDFLLTAQSRSPETTLFGRPRVSLWPVHRDVKPGQPPSEVLPRSTAMDGLLAMCGSTGTEEQGTQRAYYMQRAVPGDGWADYYTTALGANAKLIPWVTSFLDKEIPGFTRDGGDTPPADRVIHRTFAEKYGAGPGGDAANLVTLMFDYIRTTNLADGNIPKDMQFSIVCPGNPTEGYGQISPLSAASGQTGLARWQPSQWDTPRGLGRMPTISGATLVFSCRALVDEDGKIQGNASAEARQILAKPGDREMEAVILFDSFVPGQGWAESRPYCQLALAGVVPGNPADFSARLPFMNVNGAVLAPQKMKGAKDFKDFVKIVDAQNGMPSGFKGNGGGAGNFLNGLLAFKPFVVKAGVDGGEYLRFSGSDTGDGPGGIRVGVFDNPDIGFEVTTPEDTRPDTIPEEDLVQVLELHFPGTPQRRLLLPTLPLDREATWGLRLAKAVKSGDALISAQDVALSLVPPHGDMRLLAGRRWLGRNVGRPQDSIPVLVPHPDYGMRPQAVVPDHTGAEAPVIFADLPQPVDSAPRMPLQAWDRNTRVPLPDGAGSRDTVRFMTAADLFGAARLDGRRSTPQTPDRGPARPDITGDFDTGVGRAASGAYVNRADDGEVRGFAEGGAPYFDAPESEFKEVPPVSASAASPNRLVPGPGMFGSLPTGVKAQVPWQTLLFRPWFDGDADPALWNQDRDHYGWAWPRDHLLMDLFWMPVVEPYGISGPLETSGKINLNYQMLPFTGIRRATALHALLKSERVIAIPDSAADKVKVEDDAFSAVECRLPIDATGSLALWQAERDRRGQPFLSASQICELPLVPAGVTPDFEKLRRWWASHRLTGDNLKERPYTNLHARLTVRSNVYRVHILAQSLQKARSTDQTKWIEGQDTVAAAWRGSAIVSRSVDASKLPDYVATPGAPPVDEFYSWSVSGVRQIAPR